MGENGKLRRFLTDKQIKEIAGKEFLDLAHKHGYDPAIALIQRRMEIQEHIAALEDALRTGVLPEWCSAELNPSHRSTKGAGNIDENKCLSLIALYKQDATEMDHKLIDFGYGKKKAIEHSGSIDTDSEVDPLEIARRIVFLIESAKRA